MKTRAELLAAIGLALIEQLAQELLDTKTRLAALESILRHKGIVTDNEAATAVQEHDIAAGAEAALAPEHKSLRQFDRGRIRGFSVERLRELLRSLEEEP